MQKISKISLEIVENICIIRASQGERTMDKMIDENGEEWIVDYGEDDAMNFDDNEWDPIMGDVDDYPETDDQWLDDFQGEEDWA